MNESPAGRSLLDESALESYVREHLPGARGKLTIEPLTGGQSNPTFRLRVGSADYVLRKQPAGPLLPSAHAVDREYRVITALGGTEVPVPRTFSYCDDRAVIGTPFFIMEYVAGRLFWNPALPDLTKHERTALWDDVNSVIA